MTKLHSMLKITFAISTVVALIACGGDPSSPLEGDSSSDPVAKYIGSWESDCYSQDGASARVYADFTKTSASSFTGGLVAYAYLGSSCSSPSVKSKNVLTNMNLSIVGSKMVESSIADMFVGTADQGSTKTVMNADANILKIGDDKSNKDSEGYPTMFFEYKFTRR